MPKNRNKSNKRSYTLEKDGMKILIARKQKEMPMSDKERETLRDIYYEALIRTSHAKTLLESYRNYLDSIYRDNQKDSDAPLPSLKLKEITIELNDLGIKVAERVKSSSPFDPETMTFEEYRDLLNATISEFRKDENRLEAGALVEQYRDYLDSIYHDNQIDSDARFAIGSDDGEDLRFLHFELKDMRLACDDPEMVKTAKKLKRHFHLDPQAMTYEKYRAHLNDIVYKKSV